MFNKKEPVMVDEKSNQPQPDTIIGSSVQVEGNLTSQGNIIVRGTVNGNLSTQSDVFLDKGGKILADISAKNAVVHGEIKGNMTISERLEIKSTGNIQGDITTGKLIIEEGGNVNGHCKTGQMTKEASKPVVNTKLASEEKIAKDA